MEHEKMIARIDELVSEGETILSTKHSYSDSSFHYTDVVEEDMFYKWKINSLSYGLNP